MYSNIVRPNATEDTLKSEISSLKYRIDENKRQIRRIRYETERTIKKLENETTRFETRLVEMQERLADKKLNKKK